MPPRPSDRTCIITTSSGQRSHKWNNNSTVQQRDEAARRPFARSARPADELAAVLRARDYARLRDMMRNRHAGDVAALLTELSLEDQVVVFRVLPRKDAAAVFEYLSQDAKETLLKAMAQEDVAALLNNMAPDDRTMFLEELPATATRQLLALLTPEERSVALTLLGYPESSVGRLMTPHYVAVREHWTVREVLDYVRDARPGQRNAERHLRRRRAGPADRRRSHSRVPAGAARAPCRGPDGSTVRRAEGHRRSGSGRRRVPPVRSQRAAGDRHRRHAHRHRHDR